MKSILFSLSIFGFLNQTHAYLNHPEPVVTSKAEVSLGSNRGTCVYRSGSGGYDIGGTDFTLTIANPLDVTNSQMLTFKTSGAPTTDCPNLGSGRVTIAMMEVQMIGTKDRNDTDSPCIQSTIHYVQLTAENGTVLVTNQKRDDYRQVAKDSCAASVTGEIVDARTHVMCSGYRTEGDSFDASEAYLGDGFYSARCAFSGAAPAADFSFIQSDKNGSGTGWECSTFGSDPDGTKAFQCFPQP